MRLTIFCVAIALAVLGTLCSHARAAGCGRHCNDKADPDTFIECPEGLIFHTEIKGIDYNPNFFCEDPANQDNGCTAQKDGNLPLYQVVGKKTLGSATVYSLKCNGEIKKQTVVEAGETPPDWQVDAGCTLEMSVQNGCKLTTLVPGVATDSKAQVCTGGSYQN